MGRRDDRGVVKQLSKYIIALYESTQREVVMNVTTTIRDVIDTNPAVTVTTCVTKGCHYILSGYIDMDVSSGYSNIIKIRDKQFFIDIQLKKEIEDYVLHEVRDFKSLLKALNLQIG